MNQLWFVYIIEGSDDKLYTGITTDLLRRWRQHSGEIRNGAKYFRGRKPRELVYWEIWETRSEASKREAQIKKFDRAKKLELISERI